LLFLQHSLSGAQGCRNDTLPLNSEYRAPWRTSWQETGVLVRVGEVGFEVTKRSRRDVWVCSSSFVGTMGLGSSRGVWWMVTLDGADWGVIVFGCNDLRDWAENWWEWRDRWEWEKGNGGWHGRHYGKNEELGSGFWAAFTDKNSMLLRIFLAKI
jgi:hypothetical protein